MAEKVDVNEIKRRQAQSKRDRKASLSHMNQKNVMANHVADVKVFKAQKKRNKNAETASSFGEKMLSRLERSDPGLYLKTLINPEQYGPSCYPDQFSDESSLGKFIFNQKLKLGVGGEFYARINPTLSKHVIQGSPTTAGVTAYNAVQDFATPDGGLYDGHKHCPLNSSAWTTVPCFNFFQTVDGKYSLSFTDLLGFGSILVPTNSALRVYVNQMTSWANGTVTAQMIDDSGAVTALTAGAWSASITSAQKYIAFQAKTSITTLSDGLNRFSAIIEITDLGAGLVRTESNITDYQDIVSNNIYTKYRTVGMSVLLTYQGDTLNDGGQLAARPTVAGENADDLGWTDYDSIASLRGSYDGALKNGLYMIWRPGDTNDMDYREPTVDNDEGLLPAIVLAGIAVHPDTTIRLRVCLCVEAVTYKSYIPALRSRVAPHEIEVAQTLLANFPVAMENPIHLESIKKFLRDVIAKGYQFVETVAPYAKFAGSVATAVAPLLL